MSNYRDLVVWQRAFKFVKATYLVSASFPADERFGLVSQMRRAAVSIPSNMAEGCSRRTRGEFIQFISVAEGSAAELETQLLLSAELGFASAERIRKATEELIEIRKMLGALRRKLTTKS